MIAGVAFCSEVARAQREPLAGTASHARGCVLLSYPKRLWARDVLGSEGLPAELRAELERLRDEEGVVTRFVAHEGPFAGRTELTFHPQAMRYADVPLEDVAALLATARRDALPPGGVPVRTPVIACCTHGQRDRCCALFGVALTSELRRLAAASGIAVDVREASHLGGDRFAPTVLVLPSGHMYGHLDVGDAASLLAAAAGGPPLIERFRGSLWLDPLVQLAEVAALCLPGARASAPTLGAIDVVEIDDRHRVLRAEASWRDERFVLIVRCVLGERRVLGDCRSVEKNRLGSVRVWSIEDVRAEPLATSAER